MTLPDLDDFSERAYYVIRQIPEGSVATYGQIAFLAGAPRAARAVGTLLRRVIENQQDDVPWARVINAQGRISSKGDMPRAERQRRILQREGVDVSASLKVDLDVHEWQPDHGFWAVAW